MLQDKATAMATNNNTNNTTIKKELIEVVDYNPQLHGPPPRLPRKYYGNQKINDQEVYFFYDTDNEDEDTWSDEEAMTGPFIVKVRKLNNDDQKFVCVYPLVDEAMQLEPRLPRSKHIKAFDEAIADLPQPLTEQSLPEIKAVFKRVRYTLCSSSVRTPVLEDSANAPPRRFLDTNPSMHVPSPVPTLSPQPSDSSAPTADNMPVSVATAALETAAMSNEEVASSAAALEVRLLDVIPDLTDADVDSMIPATPYWHFY